jgi:hypothetical protein
VVAQRDALKCTERSAGCQRARGRGDERVHGGRDSVGAFGAGRRRGTGLAFIRIGSRSDRYRDPALHEFTAEQGEVKNAGQAGKTHKTHRIWSGPIFPERIAKLSKYKLLINSNLSTTRPGLSQPGKKTSTGLSSLPADSANLGSETREPAGRDRSIEHSKAFGGRRNAFRCSNHRRRLSGTMVAVHLFKDGCHLSMAYGSARRG